MSQRTKSTSLRSLKTDCHYLKSLVLKLMNRFEEAQENYFIHKLYCHYEEKAKMVLTCFGILMLPLDDNRRQILNFFENFLGYMNFYQERYEKIKQPMSEYFYDPKKRTWVPSRRELAITILRTKSFFKRFNATQIDNFLNHMHPEKYDADSLLFTGGRVCIVLSGAVELRQHSFDQRLSKLLGKYACGDIIGLHSIDNGITSHPEVWCMCTSEVEVAWVSLESIQKLWSL